MTDETIAPQSGERFAGADGAAATGAEAGPGPDWVAIRKSYEGDALTLAQIYTVYGVTKYQFEKKRDAEGWVRRSDRRAPRPFDAAAAGDVMAEASGVPVPVPRPRDPRPPVPVTNRGLRRWRKGMIVRLYEAMDRQLAEIEHQQRTVANRGGAERERQMRQMNIMTRRMEQLTEFHEQEAKRGKSPQRRGGAARAEAGRDPETWRLEIARRVPDDLGNVHYRTVNRFADYRSVFRARHQFGDDRTTGRG
ncbi:MAG: hypothetical protein ACR2O4_07375, partial [Hyphomicrobiaceae bacterium]